MTLYPKNTDKDYYKKINDKYKQYKTPLEGKSFEEICFPNKYELQIQQKFFENFFKPNNPISGLLIFHKIGSGKTCTGIKIAENWKKTNNKVIIVVPAFMKTSWYDEFRSHCTTTNDKNNKNDYISDDDRNALKYLKSSGTEYKNIIKNSDKIIDKHYKIYSYNKFIELLEKNKLKLDNTLLLIDEIHNLISEHGTAYNILHEKIQNKPKNFKIVVMSATPMYDKPEELALIMNLIKTDTQIPTGKEFNDKYIDENNKLINVDDLKQELKGYISYYGGTPLYTFPKATITNVDCIMSDFQYKIYDKVINSKKQDFFTKARIVSNIVFPNKKMEKEGIDSLSKTHILEDLKMYSTKIYKIVKKIKQSDGPIFVYSTYKNCGGIESLVKILECFGYKNFKNNGVGKNTFAIWSGDENNSYKSLVKSTINKKENKDGQLIKILLGSPSIKEGVSLFRIKQVHILEPYWNYSRILQIIGRASRYCSHKDVPKNKRIVDVYIYVSVHSKNKQTIDQYLINLAEKKKKLTDLFENVLKECALDCSLFRNSNMLTQKKNIICDK